MSSITSPLAGNAGQAARIVGMSVTNPTAAGIEAGFPAARAAGALPALQAGVATQYWDECVAHPPGSTASLWLLVDGGWRAHDNPSADPGHGPAGLPGRRQRRPGLVRRRDRRRHRGQRVLTGAPGHGAGSHAVTVPP